MQSYNEWVRNNDTKTITITCRDLDDTLENMLKYIKSNGNGGHSFNIDIDGKKFDWDGDGSDAIFQIEIEKQHE